MQITLDQYVQNFGADETVALLISCPSDGVPEDGQIEFDDYAEQVRSMVETALSKRFAIPLLNEDGSTATELSPVLKFIHLQILRYVLHRGQAPEPIVDRYKEAKKMLQDIANGAVKSIAYQTLDDAPEAHDRYTFSHDNYGI